MTARTTLLAATLLITVAAAPVHAWHGNGELPHPMQADALEPFAQVVGGTWSAEGSEHSFEWGLGHRTVIAHTYFLDSEGARTLVAQALWYWDPAARTIRGISITEGMPHDVVEMTSHFEGNRLVNELRTITADGSAESHAEIWEFTGPDTYAWTLHQGGLDGPVWMTDTYHRR